LTDFGGDDAIDLDSIGMSKGASMMRYSDSFRYPENWWWFLKGALVH